MIKSYVNFVTSKGSLLDEKTDESRGIFELDPLSSDSSFNPVNRQELIYNLAFCANKIPQNSGGLMPAAALSACVHCMLLRRSSGRR